MRHMPNHWPPAYKVFLICDVNDDDDGIDDIDDAYDDEEVDDCEEEDGWFEKGCAH